MEAPRTGRPLKILLAHDGSQHSLAAINLVRRLPLPAQSSIHLAGVLTPREISNQALLQAVLEQAQGLLSDMNVVVKGNVLVGQVAASLAHYADEINPDLIVMGAKGLRATLGILLGGVAQQIVEYAHWPVLVVRAPLNDLKHVLLVVDGSPVSRLAEDYLAGSAQWAGFPLPAQSQVELMHILPPVVTPERYMQTLQPGPDLLMPFHDSQLEYQLAHQAEEEECAGQALLDEAVARVQAVGIQATGMLHRGDAATEILQHAQEHQTDLIVAGSRGLGQVRGWLLGSVSRKLVHYASCSVLIVKEGLAERNPVTPPAT